MAKPEAKTDNLVRDLLKAANIVFDEQGSDIVEIDKALKTASKKGTGEIGFPEFVAVVKDFILVFEDKPTVDKHVKFVAENSTAISTDTDDIQAYAVNGAAFYGKHLIKNTTYKKCFAFGCSGNGNRLLITPMFIDDSLEPMVLENVETLSLFNDENIEDTYARDVLHEQTREQKELAQLLRDAEELHEDLRTYASLQDKDKPIVVSGILLALREPTFNVDSLIGDKQKTDGEIIYEAISAQLDRVDVSPQKKKDKVLGQFRIIKYSEPLNTFNDLLHKTPLKHYVEFLRDKVYHHVSNVSSSEDVLGRFYGEFMSYSGGDGQSLGIILTPKHITELFCELVDLTPDDTVLDPCCGTAGFLIAAMRDMLVKAGNEEKEEHIRKHQLHGVELQEYMYTIATTNMILRGDGKSNLMNADFLKTPAPDLQQKGATVGMINPPYSLAKKTKNKDLYEICFIKHLLDSLVAGGRCIAIVPQSTMAGTSKDEQAVKSSILAKHTLEGVVSLNPETFYGVGTIPCIAVFTAGKPHPENKRVKFIDFKDDGYKTQAHVGFIPTKRAPSRKQYLLDVWRDNLDADNDFCIKTTVKDTDEWLHSFYYFNDALPAEEDFAKTIGDYLTFEFSMVMRNKQDLFKTSPDEEPVPICELDDKQWKGFFISDLAVLEDKKQPQVPTGASIPQSELMTGSTPRISATSNNNGILSFCHTEHKNKREHENFISVSFLGNAFYHPYKATLDMKIHALRLKDHELNKYIALFIVVCLDNNTKSTSYGDQLSSTDLPRKKILLPVNDDDLPDYEYMEQYIKNVMIAKYRKYLDYVGYSADED